MKHQCLIAVRYQETDRMGVVHHSVYPIYFEQARTELFEAAGLPYHTLEEGGLYSPVLDYTVSLKGRLTYGDRLRLEAAVTEFRGLRFRFAYQGWRTASDEDVLVVRGSSEHALVGPDLRPLHPRRLPACYEQLKRLFEARLEPT